jgi:hypothetical protein
MHWRVVGPERVRRTEGHGGSVNPPRDPCRGLCKCSDGHWDPERIAITPIGMPRGHFPVAALQLQCQRAAESDLWLYSLGFDPSWRN